MAKAILKLTGAIILTLVMALVLFPVAPGMHVAQAADTYIVTFDGNGGDPATQTREVKGGSGVNTLPTPTRNGYLFIGWFSVSGDSGGTRFTPLTAVTSDRTVYARWSTNSRQYYYSESGGKATLTAYYGVDENLTIPNTLGGYPVTAIGYQAFQGNTTLKSVTIPNGVTSIGQRAFDRCTALTTVNVPASVTTVGWQAFYGCSRLTSIYFAGKFPSSFGDEEKDIFEDCGSNLTLYCPTGDTSWNALENTGYPGVSIKRYAYTVTFNANGGPGGTTRTVLPGLSLGSNMPADPTRSGYNFRGWFNTSAATGGTQFFSTTAVSSNTTVYARWTPITYTVTFYANGGSPTPARQTINQGSRASSPSKLSRSGHNFGGWYQNPACTGAAWNFSSNTVTKNITLYAKWTPITYKVTFKKNGGGATPAQQTINSGNKATRPTNPKRSGYTFGGWYQNDACTGWAWNFSLNTVTSNITLYAKWTRITYTVSFDRNGGNSTPPRQTINSGHKAKRPTNPKRSGYTFGGWYQNTAGTGKAWDFKKNKVTKNIILYAKWNPTLATLVDNAVPASCDVDINTLITVRAPKGVTLYYTINGKNPTTKTKTKINAGNVRQFEIKKATTLRVIGKKKGEKASKVFRRQYTLKQAPTTAPPSTSTPGNTTAPTTPTTPTTPAPQVWHRCTSCIGGIISRLCTSCGGKGYHSMIGNPRCAPCNGTGTYRTNCSSCRGQGGFWR